LSIDTHVPSVYLFIYSSSQTQRSSKIKSPRVNMSLTIMFSIDYKAHLIEQKLCSELTTKNNHN